MITDTDTDTNTKEEDFKQLISKTLNNNNPNKQLKSLMKEFFENRTKEITVSVFNHTTYKQNTEYRKKNNIQCIYSSFEPFGRTIDKNKGVYVLEADISQNKIRGIGFIKLNKNTGIYKEIYEEPRYNNYTYTGNYHISQDEMTEDELSIMKIVEQLCFYGKTHLKRYSGIKRFPQKWIYNLSESVDLLDFITRMFEKRKI
jgi:hypothetical protein